MDDLTRNYGCTHSSLIHPANKSIFASLEATDSTSSLPYPSVLLVFLEFTMVAKGMKLMALTEGISIRQFIDSWLIRTNSKQQCQENTHWLVHLVESLGWITNF